MRTPLLVLALALAAPLAAAQSHHPGPVILLGERADPALVPELARAPERSVLLVAESKPSPAPLDAGAWGCGQAGAIVHLAPAAEREVDRTLLSRLRAADLVAFGPGSTREWLEALLERERASALLNAVHEAWSDGATLVGRGDSAALLSAAFAVSGAEELDWDIRNPTDDGGSRAAQGLGYQPWAMLDTQTRSAGSLRRLVRSVCRERIELALYLPAEAAVVVDLTGSLLRVHGSGEVLLIDSRRARRNRASVQTARLTVLPSGAVWSASERRVALRPETTEPLDPAGDGRYLVEHLYDPSHLGSQAAPEGTPLRRWMRDDGRRRLELRFDQSSRWGRIGGGAGVPNWKATCWVEGLACDLSADGL